MGTHCGKSRVEERSLWLQQIDVEKKKRSISDYALLVMLIGFANGMDLGHKKFGPEKRFRKSFY